MADTVDALGGGCLCGRVRYRLARVPDDVAHCHCRICQRSTGAPVVTWATLSRADLTIAGEPSWYRSSAAARRGFCPACGTQLFFAFDAEARASRPDVPDHALAEIDVAVATLDEPDRCRPTRNIWTTSRRAFLHGFDATLPDFVDEGPFVTPAVASTDTAADDDQKQDPIGSKRPDRREHAPPRRESGSRTDTIGPDATPVRTAGARTTPRKFVT